MGRIFKMSAMMAFFILATSLSAVAGESHGSQATQGGGAGSSGAGGCGGEKSKFSKADIEKMAKEVHGDKAACYMKLYDGETGSNPSCEQQHVPNPPGVAICTLEGDPNMRKSRGEACAVPNDKMNANTEDGVKQQMKCCQEIMKKNGNAYFQGVKEGKLENCETGQTGKSSGGKKK